MAVEIARARVEQALFGTSAPARVGRYEIRAPIASGGMGMVYRGYDPELDRDVALKVIHPDRAIDPAAPLRLAREARALARLRHPNVVTVYDVLVQGGSVVVVMELVTGETLASWAARAPRPWRAIVDVYVQAAEGLAAAHALGVIHRDFKPANAIVGEDGRVRVLDFGLARVGADEQPPRGKPSGPRDEALTGAGDVLGTLAYASPEQLAGGVATAPSDQFSLCASLHQALEGVPAFTGATPAARLAAIEAGAPQLGGGRGAAPAWLRAVLRRGLALRPEDRYPDLRALIATLRRPHGWRRWRAPTLVVAAAALSAVVALGLAPSSAPTCEGGADELAAAWPLAARARLAQAIAAIGGPYARSVGPEVVVGLDRYASTWRVAHRAACVAHRAGAASADGLDRQMGCLAQRLTDLRAATDVLASTDAARLGHAMEVVAGLPAIARCADLARLGAELPPPDDPAVRRRVESLRAQLSTVEALARAGRAEQALVGATRVRAEARSVPYAPVEIEAALAEGRLRVVARDLEGARAALGPARARALEAHLLAAAVEASARLIYVEGMWEADLSRLERDLAYAAPLSAGLADHGFARALLLNNVGAVYLSAERRAEAARYFTWARAEVERAGNTDPELFAIDLNLAIVTADDRDRGALARRGWERLRAALGAHHLQTLEALGLWGLGTRDPSTALRLLTEAVDGYREAHPDIGRLRVAASLARAVVAAELPDRAAAIAGFDEVIAVARAIPGGGDEDTSAWRRYAEGRRALLAGDAPAAVRALEPVYRAQRGSPRWWERAEALRAAVALGEAEGALGHDPAAIAYLERAVAEYPKVCEMNENVEHRRHLAHARSALAAALRRARREPARADALAQAAAAFYRDAGYPAR